MGRGRSAPTRRRPGAHRGLLTQALGGACLHRPQALPRGLEPRTPKRKRKTGGHPCVARDSHPNTPARQSAHKSTPRVIEVLETGVNAANADQQGATGAGACPSLRALGENAHSPLTPTPSAAPGTRTRGVAISRPHVLRAHLRGICLTLGPLRRSGGFSLSAVQVIDNLRHMLATPNSPTGTRPGLPFYGRDGLPIQFSVQRFDPARTPWGIRHCVDISGHDCPQCPWGGSHSPRLLVGLKFSHGLESPRRHCQPGFRTNHRVASKKAD